MYQNSETSNTMQIQPFKTITYGKNSLKYSAPLVWNNQNEEFKTCKSLNSFKQLLKLWYGVTCHNVASVLIVVV